MQCHSAERAHPSEAKALCFKAISGMAEAVPIQNAIYAAAQRGFLLEPLHTYGG
jgi:hypothetical protein